MLQAIRSNATGFARLLIDETERQLRNVRHDVHVEHAIWDDGEFHLTAFSPGVSNEVEVGDYVYAGFFLAHNPMGHTETSARVYRVACKNGMLTDGVEGQRIEFSSVRPPRFWKRKLKNIIELSFDNEVHNEQSRQLRATLHEMLPTPYEYLIHLVAQGLISEDERELIQREFTRADDATLYGLVNAITHVAHAHRSQDEWRRAMRMERLGGQVAGGDHRPPIGSPVYH